MKIYDVTLPLRNDMPVYPSDPPFKRRVTRRISKKSGSEVSLIRTGSHVGTHVDAPAHMVRGAMRVDRLPLKALLGPARVVDLRRARGHINAEDLRRIDLRGAKRILFRTRNSAAWKSARRFDREFAAFTEGAAKYLASKRILLVGVDGLSVDRFGSGSHPAHIILMKAGMTIVEGLDLDGVPAGNYLLFCGPMKIRGGDGAPARVFLARGLRTNT